VDADLITGLDIRQGDRSAIKSDFRFRDRVEHVIPVERPHHDLLRGHHQHLAVDDRCGGRLSGRGESGEQPDPGGCENPAM
jgi:hypothetical protein